MILTEISMKSDNVCYTLLLSVSHARWEPAKSLSFLPA